LCAVAWYRDLDERPGPRGYYKRIDEEGLYDKGGRWLWETITVSTKIIAIKQIEVTSDGVVRPAAPSRGVPATGTGQARPVGAGVAEQPGTLGR
jgi:hypothetical protein